MMPVQDFQSKMTDERGLIGIQSSYGKEEVECDIPVYIVHFCSTT